MFTTITSQHYIASFAVDKEICRPVNFSFVGELFLATPNGSATVCGIRLLAESHYKNAKCITVLVEIYTQSGGTARIWGGMVNGTRHIGGEHVLSYLCYQSPDIRKKPLPETREIVLGFGHLASVRFVFIMCFLDRADSRIDRFAPPVSSRSVGV